MAYKYTWICSFFTYQLLMKPSLGSFCTTPLLIYSYKYSKKLNISSSKLYSDSFIYIALIFCTRSYWQWKATIRVTWWVRTIHSVASINKWTNGCMFLLISHIWKVKNPNDFFTGSLDQSSTHGALHPRPPTHALLLLLLLVIAQGALFLPVLFTCPCVILVFHCLGSWGCYCNNSWWRNENDFQMMTGLAEWERQRNELNLLKYEAIWFLSSVIFFYFLCIS